MDFIQIRRLFTTCACIYKLMLSDVDGFSFFFKTHMHTDAHFQQACSSRGDCQLHEMAVDLSVRDWGRAGQHCLQITLVIFWHVFPQVLLVFVFHFFSCIFTKIHSAWRKSYAGQTKGLMQLPLAAC